MRVVFIGTAELGVPTLRALAEKHEILAVITQPDRPAGRGLRLQPPPIKTEALKLGLTVHQPEKIRNEIGLMKRLSPDLVFAVAYGQILSGDILKIPCFGAVNLHASLLPKYRGAAPIPWAIINGEKLTGLTTFLMDEGMDTGPILLQKDVPIAEDDTAGTLSEKLAALSPELVLHTLEGLGRGTLKPRPQDNSTASYAPKIRDELGKLDWRGSAEKLHNLIRGLNPKPGAYTFFKNLRLKVHRSKIAGDTHAGTPGQIVALTKEGLVIRCGDGALELLEVQPEAKVRMSGRDFIHGYKLKVGDRFSESA